MNETEVLNQKAAFHQKMKQLSQKVIAANWDPDKSYEIGKGKPQIVKYVSLSKIRRNFAPILADASINMDEDWAEPKNIGESVCAEVTIIWTDTETGYSESFRSFGTSSKGEKAYQIAQAFAMKTYLTNKFHIIDGVDPERDDSSAPKSGFAVKSMAEVEEIKSQIQENAMPKEELVQVNEKELEESKGMTDKVLGYIMSPIEARTVNNIEAKWKQKLESGEITEAQYKEMDDARLDANSKEATLAFIRKFKVI